MPTGLHHGGSLRDRIPPLLSRVRTRSEYAYTGRNHENAFIRIAVMTPLTLFLCTLCAGWEQIFVTATNDKTRKSTYQSSQSPSCRGAEELTVAVPFFLAR